jgi:septum formation protein
VSIYLASQSPRRRELLMQIGVPHELISASVVEMPLLDEAPSAYVQRLALEKACAGWVAVQAQEQPLKPVLGADTIVVCNGYILEKPRDKQHFVQMMTTLSGSQHEVITAVALVMNDKKSCLLSVTHVSFREIEAQEIDAYWHTGEPCDKAGGYGIQGLGAVFVRELRGSYSGVVGLPIEQTVSLLKEFGVSWWQL